MNDWRVDRYVDGVFQYCITGPLSFNEAIQQIIKWRNWQIGFYKRPVTDIDNIVYNLRLTHIQSGNTLPVILILEF